MRERLARLILAKSRQIYMMHGTTSKLARKILKEGLNPKPKTKVWDTKKNPGMESLSGTYVTKNWHNATIAAMNAADKFGGKPLYVVLKLAIRQPHLRFDEDILSWSLFTRLFGVELQHNIGHGNQYKIMYSLTKGEFKDLVKQLAEEMLDFLAADILRAYISSEEDRPKIKELSAALKKVAWDELVEMIIAATRYGLAAHYEAFKDSTMSKPSRTGIDIFGEKLEKLDPTFKDIVGIEMDQYDYPMMVLKKDVESLRREFRKKQEDFLDAVKKFTELALQSDGGTSIMTDNVRVTVPITFRGANRIVAMYEELSYKDDDYDYNTFRIIYESDRAARDWFVKTRTRGSGDVEITFIK